MFGTRRVRTWPVESATSMPVQPRTGVCPTCGHPADARPSPSFRLPGMRPAPAACHRTDGVDDPSGWPTECGCTAAFHGS